MVAAWVALLTLDHKNFELGTFVTLNWKELFIFSLLNGQIGRQQVHLKIVESVSLARSFTLVSFETEPKPISRRAPV